MAKTKTIRYSEPADYFPKEIRKMFEDDKSKKTTKKKICRKELGTYSAPLAGYIIFIP